MASVLFDAPQSIGDEILGPDVDDGLGELNGTIVDVEITEDSGLAEVAGASDLPDYKPDDVITVTEPIATEASGDPVQAANEQLTQVAQEQSGRSDEADLLDQIWNAERDCRKAESRVELLKEELKEAKSQYEQSMLRLREIINENSGCFHNSSRTIKVEVEPYRVPEIKDWTAPADISLVPSFDEPQAVEEQPPTAWRAVPLSELLREPIKGLGAKKQEALIDLCPTLGDLEDLRARVGREAAQFHELLPKGIGLETASTIEDRLLTWIAKNPKACEEAGSDSAKRDKRADQLADDPAGLTAQHAEGNGYWHSGRDAWNAGAGIEECPWTPGIEQDDWLRGWMSADEDDKAKMSSKNEPEKPATKTGILQQASSLDDL